MTPLDFQIAVSYTRLRHNAIRAASRVLIDGQTLTETGKQLGISPQAVRAAVERVKKGLLKSRNCPEGYHVVTVCVPLSAVGAVLDLEKQFASSMPGFEV